MLKLLRKKIAGLRREVAPHTEPRRKMKFETLEPRILLSADIGLEHHDPVAQEQAAVVAIEQPLVQTPDPAVVAADDTSAADTPGLARPTEVVLVDPSVDGYQSLLDGLRSPSGNLAAYEIHVLDAGRDGFVQVDEILQGRDDVAAVHLLSHGSEGEVRLGGSVLNAETAGLHAAELGSWGEAIGPDGDFLLYGCNAAAGPDGVSFVATLSALTGADVAASDDATGAAALGGDWDLEHAVGSVQARTLSPGSYSGLMTGFTGTSADENFTGTAAADTYFFSDDWGADTLADAGGTGDTLDFSAVTADMTVTFHADGSVSAASGASTLDRATGLERIIAGSGVNTFVFENGATFAGTIDGGAGTLDFSAYTTDLTVHVNADGTLSAGSLGEVLGRASGVAAFIGGSGDNAYLFADGAAFAGTIDGGAGGANTLDYSAWTAAVAVDLAAGTASGAAGVSNMRAVIGGSAGNTVAGDVEDNDFTGAHAGDVYIFADGWGTDAIVNPGSGDTDALDFSGVTSDLTVTFRADGTLFVTDGANALTYSGDLAAFTGGSGNNAYVFENGATFAGVIDGGAGGTNTLDFSGYATPVHVDLQSGAFTLGGSIQGSSMIDFSALTPVAALNSGHGIDTATLPAGTALAALGVNSERITAATLLTSQTLGNGVDTVFGKDLRFTLSSG